MQTFLCVENLHKYSQLLKEFILAKKFDSAVTFNEQANLVYEKFSQANLVCSSKSETCAKAIQISISFKKKITRLLSFTLLFFITTSAKAEVLILRHTARSLTPITQKLNQQGAYSPIDCGDLNFRSSRCTTADFVKVF